MKKQPLHVDLNFSTLVELLEYRAQANPEIKAYTFLADGEIEQAHLTYDALDREARAIGCHLQERKAIGKRVLLMYPTGLEFIAAFFGCLYAGAIAVPTYPPRAKENMQRLQAVVNDAQITLAMTNASLWPKIQARLDKTTGMTKIHLINTDDIDSKNCSNFKKAVVNSNDLAFIQYTSGSTGNPKGVMLNHQNLLHNQHMIAKAIGYTEESVSVGWLPQFHDLGLIGHVLQPLFLGFPHIFMPPVAFLQKPARWLHAISHYKATTSGGPNFAYDLCVRKISPELRRDLDLTNWQVAFVGAEPVRAETLTRFAMTFEPYGFRREALYPCYGLAESTLLVSGGRPSAAPIVQTVESPALSHHEIQHPSDTQRKVRQVIGCGQGWLDQKILIVDPQTLKPCQPGQVGEIWVSGTSVAQGYWKQPTETANTFQAYLSDTNEGPFLRTGDLGFMQERELFVAGRLKDLIIIGGQNHYPQDIESTVEESHKALRVGCGGAFSVNQTGTETVAIVQEIEHHFLRTLDINKVVGAIQQAVSEQHGLQVHAILLLKPGSIPKTSSGKIKRYACKADFLEGRLDVVGEWREKPSTLNVHQEGQAPALNIFSETTTLAPNQTDIQAWLVNQLSTYLKVPSHEIDIQVPTAQYGLDSSVAVSLTGQLAMWLDLKLEPTLFWEFPSIEALASHLSQEVQTSNIATLETTHGKS